MAVPIGTLIKKELTGIFLNKRYILTLAAQLIILFSILPLLTNFLATGTPSITTPALTQFIPVGVVDESPDSRLLWDALLNNDRIKVIPIDGDELAGFEGGKVAGILFIAPEYDEGLNKVLDVVLFIDGSNIKSEAVFDALLPSIDKVSEIIRERRIREFGVSLDNPLEVKKIYSRPLVIDKGEARFSSFFLTYLVPLMLFFPIFTIGSIILDSIVGERERKTTEYLIASPIRRSRIILSQFMALTIFIIIQLVFWFMAFSWYGIPIENRLLLLMFILLIDSAVIATALLLAYYSRTVKEANILLMFLYTTVFIFLIVSLSINYFGRSLSTPVSIVSRLLIGEDVPIRFWGLLLSIYTATMVLINVKMIERDDIIFGPRPGVIQLLSDLASWLYSAPGMAGYAGVAIVFSALAILYASIVEIAAGLILVFGVGLGGFVVPVFALIEEIIKPLGIYILSRSRGLSGREGIYLGMASGLFFFVFETLFIAIAAYYLFPDRLLNLLKVRAQTTLIIHLVASGLVGYGFVKKRYILFLIIATILHSVFNLTVTGGRL